MIVSHFLKWMSTASVDQRMAATGALARAFLNNQIAFEDRCEAEAALTLLLDDPSPKVRATLAEALSMSRHAPLQIITALASDQDEVAACILVRSPLLGDVDLIERVAASRPSTQTLIASRPLVSMNVSAAIAEVGALEACIVLAQNGGAQIASLSFRRMVERFGHEAALREVLLNDRRLPADCRHSLLVALGKALQQAPLVRALMGEARAERVTREACMRASLTLIEHTPSDEYEALIEHLRLRGDLNAGFLLRAIAHGKVDFFGAALIVLSGHSKHRVRTVLANGRDVAVTALFGAAGLVKSLHRVFLAALKVWRDVATGKRIAGAQEVSWLMLNEIGGAPAQAGPAEDDRAAAALIRTIHLEALRDNAREQALAIAAA